MIGFLCLKNSIIRESEIKCGKNLTLLRYGMCLCGELAPLDMLDLREEAALIVKSCLLREIAGSSLGVKAENPSRVDNGIYQVSELLCN